MKIAMIGHKYIPSRTGGIEVVVDELTKGLVSEGHEVHVYNRSVPQQAGADPKQKRYGGARLIWVPTFAASSLNAAVYSVLASVRALAGGYDVVHIHAEGPAAMTWLLRLFCVPVVVTIHGLDWQRAKWGGLAKAYLRFGEWCAAKLANKLIVLTKAAQDYFYECYGRHTVHIPNGIARQSTLPPKRILAHWGLEQDGYLLFLARLVPEKGLHHLLQAYSGLNTEKRLVIAGEIDEADRYTREIIALAKRDKRVIMTGFVTGETVTELYSGCDCYILPSDLEGMAVSLLEALSFGCRCVVSDIPENKETAQEFAAYFRCGDAEDLRCVLDEELRRGKAECTADEQIRFVERRYSWSRMVRETLTVYEELADENYHGK